MCTLKLVKMNIKIFAGIKLVYTLSLLKTLQHINEGLVVYDISLSHSL
jgi:hypothetical protein